MFSYAHCIFILERKSETYSICDYHSWHRKHLTLWVVHINNTLGTWNNTCETLLAMNSRAVLSFNDLWVLRWCLSHSCERTSLWHGLVIFILVLNLKSETLSGKDKKQFFLEAPQPNHQRSLPAGHFTNVSQVKGEPTSFNWCSQPRVKGSRFVEKVKPKR